MCARRFGVYATRPACRTAARCKGVANLGRRPTVGGTVERLEVHLFDFDEDLYGQTVETALIAFLRPEMKFDGLDALKAQIAGDAAAARKALGGKLISPLCGGGPPAGAGEAGEAHRGGRDADRSP